MKGLSFIILMSSITISACSQKVADISSNHVSATENTQVKWVKINSQKKLRTTARPAHLIYQMTGDYADLVPVTLDNMGNLQSYPDPVDVTDSQRPVALGDGWYLDRRGIGENTAFLDYTYAEYHALPKVPDQATLKAHVKVRNGIGTIWNCGKETHTLEEYKKLVKDGFPRCKCISHGMPVMTK